MVAFCLKASYNQRYIFDNLNFAANTGASEGVSFVTEPTCGNGPAAENRRARPCLGHDWVTAVPYSSSCPEKYHMPALLGAPILSDGATTYLPLHPTWQLPHRA